jgi:hypothetical protein
VPAEPVDPPAAAPLSLREVAENAYDEVIDAPEPEAGSEPAGQDGRTRDSLGRFAPKTTTEAKPGEAAEPPAPPSPDKEQLASPQDPAHPAPQGRSSEPPANWSAADRELFAKQTPEAKEFLLRRHSEMEGDYQRRVTATASATQFTQAVAPIFNDPVIAGSLQQSNLSPFDAIREWASMHKRAMSPDARDRAQLWHEIGTRLGLDPAAVYGQSQSGPAAGNGQLSEADLKDPAIRYFADHVGRTVQEVQALRGQIVAMQRMESEKANAEAVKVTRWGIDSFAEEKDAQGNLVRPDFDAVLPQIIELFNANPNRDLREAYETARWMSPQTRSGLIAAERTAVQRQFANDRAKAAVRGNARGVTSPVSRPPNAGKGQSLRDTLEATADEIGL